MLLIVQNDREVPAAAYGALLAREKVPCRVVRAYEEELPGGVPQAAIILGGAMGVHEKEKHPFLRGVCDLVGNCLEHDIPLLGICLGGQLLAEVSGGLVTPQSGEGEKGLHPVSLAAAGEADPLFAGVPREFLTFQWHDDSFRAPQGGLLLALSERCPHQAFRIGNSWGLQFHPEVDREVVAAWSRWSAETAAAAPALVAAFAQAEPAFRAASDTILLNFLRLAGLR